MKTYHIMLICLCLLSSACLIIQPSYFGDRLAPTTSVDIYYSAHDVKQGYRVIGHLTIPNVGQDSVKAKFVAYGKTIGADAIVILGNTVDAGGKYSSDIVNADTLKYDK